MHITLDNRFIIKAIAFDGGYTWTFYDEVDNYSYWAQEPAKDQTTVLLLAAEIIKERY